MEINSYYLIDRCSHTKGRKNPYMCKNNPTLLLGLKELISRLSTLSLRRKHTLAECDYFSSWPNNVLIAQNSIRDADI